MKNQQPR